MKKTNKGKPPAGLIRYLDSNPNSDWTEFRSAENGLLYKNLRQKAITDQGGLCAYCEDKYKKDGHELFSIEHFLPKSKSVDGNNLALDWQNMLAVCRGGRDSYNIEKELYPTPENLSCDAYKDHVGNILACLNPLKISANKLFQFNKATHELEPYEDLEPDLAQQVKDTIEVLNLNCQRLCDARYRVLIKYNKLIERARKNNNRLIKQELTHRWLSNPWPSFFSTRRCLLGSKAEKFLNKSGFNG